MDFKDADNENVTDPVIANVHLLLVLTAAQGYATKKKARNVKSNLCLLFAFRALGWGKSPWVNPASCYGPLGVFHRGATRLIVIETRLHCRRKRTHVVVVTEQATVTRTLWIVAASAVQEINLLEITHKQFRI